MSIIGKELHPIDLYFIPPSFDYYLSLTVTFFLLLLLLSMAVTLQVKKEPSIVKTTLFLSAFFIVLNVAFILFSSINTMLDSTPHRYLAVIYTPVVALILFGIECLRNVLNGFFNRKFFSQIIVLVICLSWLNTPLYLSYVNVDQMLKFGIKFGTWGYSHPLWVNSDLIQYLKHNPLNGRLFSNAPDAVYILCELKAKMIPSRSSDLDNFLQVIQESTKDCYLIWHDSLGWRTHLFSIDELSKVFRLDKIRKFQDGIIYKIQLNGAISMAL